MINRGSASYELTRSRYPRTGNSSNVINVVRVFPTRNRLNITLSYEPSRSFTRLQFFIKFINERTIVSVIVKRGDLVEIRV